MKKKICMMLLALGMLGATVGCAMQENYSIQLDTVYDGEEIDLCAAAVRKYLNEESEEGQAEILSTYGKYNLAYQNTTFRWESDGSTKYTVYFADNEKFEDAICYETEDIYIDQCGIFYPGKTYYWKVEGNSEGSCSPVDTFRTMDAPVRYITTNEVINVRDLGGWNTEAGEKVNYGFIYRGGKTNPYGGNELNEEDVELFKEQLGIRTEIDLRTANQDDGSQTESVFGKDVLYVKAPIVGYTYILPSFSQEEPKRAFDEIYTNSIQVIFKVLSRKENYPVYFHCNAGADRTGTLAFLINGLLGVSYEDLTRDFELTSFSAGGNRWRSMIDKQTGLFDDTGVMQDDAGNYVAWEFFYQKLMNEYGKKDGTLQDAIENYLKTECFISDEEIQSIKQIMLK